DEDAVGQSVGAAPMPALGAAVQALAVEHSIHLCGAGAPALSLRFAPVLGKIFRILAPALETRAVPGGERGWLIEKKQFSIELPPYVAVPFFEREHAADPLPRSPAPRRECLR